MMVDYTEYPATALYILQKMSPNRAYFEKEEHVNLDLVGIHKKMRLDKLAKKLQWCKHIILIDLQFA